MKRNINQTREMACDELVAESLLKPLDYAGSLVQIAGFITPSSHDAYTLGVFSADILEKRIMKLIETSRGANQRLGKIRFLFVVTLLGITAMATSVFSLALPVKQTSLALPVKQTQDEKSITVSAGILNNKVVNLVKPIYPAAAKAVNASGTVNVEIVIDEKGNVISAEAVSGHPLLKITSVNAARESQFAPTLLEGKPVKVTGVLSYSFSSATDEPTETNVDSDNIKGGAEEGEINPLRILSKPIPQYTEQARKNGISGSVKLRVTFLASGSIGDISPVNSLPDGLTEIAIEAAKGIKFEPATKNGERLTVTRLLEYSFTNF
jgi:TonB family protein